MFKQGKIITITGPTCSGKSTLESMLIFTPGFQKVVSHTTRQPRPGELHGKNYNFVTTEEFVYLAEAGEFLETVRIGDTFYGATKDQFRKIIKSGDHAVVVVEPHGRDQILQFAHENAYKTVAVFLGVLPGVQARRFLDRVYSEFALNLSNGDKLTKSIDANRDRLAFILGDERSWCPPLISTWNRQDINFGRFDTNAELVVKTIVGAANAD